MQLARSASFMYDIVSKITSISSRLVCLKDKLLSVSRSFVNPRGNVATDITCPYQVVRDFKLKHPKHLIVSHLNINSYCNKFVQIQPILLEELVHILGISESKLSISFPKDQFKVPNYKDYRLDRNEFGGGLILYVHSTLPHCPPEKAFYENIEYMVLNLEIKGKKWSLLYIYKPPNVRDATLCELLYQLHDSLPPNTDLSLSFGDLNCNFMFKCNLSTACEILDLTNLIKGPTCFKSREGTLLDVFLTNKPRSFVDSFNVDLGISDFHNFVGVATRMHAPVVQKNKITYRSMKHFSPEVFKQEVSQIPFHVSNIFDDVDDSYWFQDRLFQDVLNEHAPLKTKSIKPGQYAFMNAELRKAMHTRNMWRNKHFADRNNQATHKEYTKWRNRVTELSRTSVDKYIETNCNSHYDSKRFNDTIKPFISNKSNETSSKIFLSENNEIISDSKAVAEIFNKFYASIAEYKTNYDGIDIDSLENILLKHSNHPSICMIKNKHRKETDTQFHFQKISHNDYKTYIKKLVTKPSSGHDNVQSKFLKMCADDIAGPYCDIFNRCVETSSFPSDMKFAEIGPLYKKKDSLNKNNYRSVNLLIVMSKIYERIMSDQIIAYFLNILNPSLSAYRKGYSCQHVILQLTECWRDALDNNKYVGTVASDLSKAFDTMPHGLLIAKLSAYGLSNNACVFISSYLKNRKQRVKIGGEKSDWSTINRGVPQGSVLGPLLFNIFINDFFYAPISSTICNYADDNHLCKSHESISELSDILRSDSLTALEWFKSNDMDANPDKFQCTVLGRDIDSPFTFDLEGNTIIAEDKMKVLGVTLDDKLSFDYHISNICKIAAPQIGAFRRISPRLNEINRIRVYTSFIRSNFCYSPVTWIFCGKGNALKLEKLQERALKCVFMNSKLSYHELLEKGNFLPLSIYRLKFLAIEVFKCINDMNPVYINELFQMKYVPYHFRDSSRLTQNKFNTTTYGYRSFTYYGAKLWNCIPYDIKNTTDLETFKTNISIWCRSPFCKTLEIF